MSASFDPYHRWLSIPPDEQPPHHYRLLGLRACETDIDVISSAAERQIVHVRHFLDTPMHPYAVNLVRELQVARRCLLDREAKVAYDAWLQSLLSKPAGQLASQVQQPAPRAFAPVSTQTVRQVRVANEGISKPIPDAPLITPIVTYRSRRRKKSSVGSFFWLLQWVLGGVLGLLAGYAVLSMIDPDNDLLRLIPQQLGLESSTLESPRTNPMPRVDLPPIPTPRRRPVKPRNGPPTVEPREWSPEQQDDPILGDDEVGRIIRPLPNPLANLPPHFGLPPIRQTTPETLAAIPQDALDGLELSLIDGGSGEEGSLSLSREEPAGSKEPSWVVRWTPAANDLQGVVDAAPSDVGTFTLGDDQLRFVWEKDAESAEEIALQNSLLRIQSGGHNHVAALRVPILLPPLTIDLKRPISYAVCKCDHLPDLNSIRVDITDYVNFPPYRVEGVKLKGLGTEDQMTLWYLGTEGAATKITIVRKGNLPAIEAESRYRLPSGDEEGMSISRGNRKIKALQRELSKAKDAQAALPELERYLTVELPLSLSEAQSMKTEARLPTGKYGEWPELAWKKRLLISDIEEKMSAAELRVGQAKELAGSVPEIERDLAAIQKVAELAQLLHDKARLEYRFYFLVDGHEVDLAVSNATPQ